MRPSSTSLSRPRARLAWWALLFALWLALGPARAATALQVDQRSSVPVWPAVTLLKDPAHAYTAEQLLAEPQRFAPPQGTPSNLGRTPDTVWLLVPLHVPGAVVAQRVLEIDYPALNEIEFVLAREGGILSRGRMGNTLRLQERPLPTRTHAVELQLPPGDSVLLLRLRTQSTMALPITLRTPASFTAQESRSQMLQGINAGLALCMLIYSLLHWVGLRDRAFLDYALLLGANAVFTLNYFGIGAQYLWPDHPAISTNISPMAVLVAVYAGMHFMRITLGVRMDRPRTERAMRGIGYTAVAGLALGIVGLLDYRALQTLATILGLASTAVVLPTGFTLARQGERVAMYMLFGWTAYMCGAATTAGLLRGLLEPTFWTQYLYPISTTIEMSAWMAVLGLRVQSIHRNADRARMETESMRKLAQTDALTGLPNRRGLGEHLDRSLQACRPGHLLAVYLLDLDGFKPVNDRHGHDVGDALLVAVGRRLQEHLRGSDVVARLGGDEFVVLATGLGVEADAMTLGQKLLAAFEQPFDALGRRCEVGLTIGYALAPTDGSTAEEMLKRADEAMYAGKQAGRRRVQRAVCAAVSSPTLA